MKSRSRAPLRHAGGLATVEAAIIACERCPRLRAYCQRVASEKRAAYRDWTYWGRPVPGFGDAGGRVLILGLAPAAHGANRTGRVFTGDGVGGSGDFLMAALHRAGFANIPTSRTPDDGLRLTDAYIAAAVRCAPPANKPTPAEVAACLDHLEAELACLPNIDTVVALGRIAWDAWLQRLAATASGRARAPPSATASCGRPGAARPSTGRLLSPLAPEHQHGDGHRGDVRRGVPAPGARRDDPAATALGHPPSTHRSFVASRLPPDITQTTRWPWREPASARAAASDAAPAPSAR